MADLYFASLDERRFSAFHARTILTTGLGVFCDGYDISSISLVLGPALKAYGVAKMTTFEAGALTASALVGSILGALAFGAMAQRGRKRFYGVDALILGVAALAQAFMPPLGALIACRFVLGIGVGADYVLSPVIMAEHANRADRGKALGLGFGTMWYVGALAAAVLQLLLQVLHVPSELIWKIVLAAGCIPALGVIGLRRSMPETARYLARLADDQARAGRVMQDIGGVAAAPPPADARPFWQVFRQHVRLILAGAVLWMVYDLVTYAGILFGPNIIAESLGMSPAIYQILNEGAFIIPAALLASWLVIDKLGRKPLQVGGFVLSAVALAVFAVTNSVRGVGAVWRFIIFELFNVAQVGPGLVSGAGVYGVELAPTRIRSVAQAVTVVGGRIGASIAGFVFPLMKGGLGLATSMWVLVALSLAGAILSQLLVPETTARSLEEINMEPAPAAAPERRARATAAP